MGLKCGIVGLPNVGKSTIFNALTKSHAAEAANYPFCTIDPNVGVVEVPDERFDKICELVKPQRRVPAVVEFVDIAGLVKGASKGEGLGNAFLSHIRQVDALLHIVRCFHDDKISHVSGQLSPKEDVETIELELILADLEVVQRKLENLAKKRKGGDKKALEQTLVLEKIHHTLEQGKPARNINLADEEKESIKELSLLSLKPVLFVGNVDEAYVTRAEESPLYQELLTQAKTRGSPCLAICGKLEAELAVMPKEEMESFLQEYGLKEAGLNQVIREAYRLLGYITFFTAGENEVRAWNILKNTKAPQAAGEIHSDMERGFIRAEVTSYDDFIACGSLKKAQEMGKMRLEGKDYIMADGDIVYFRFAV
ncbi:MAG: redox-regulated ATPase YchF [Leptospiraceae bacterium]|nr:redox-regulated ATPase YchF [Leptospiraceae bacterium]MDW8306131.1 redox-regulated ATPase YchF [Leptospiraceae bacterium]